MSDTETNTAVYRLSPIAPPSDPRWDNATYHGEVLVRALSSGDARIVAANAEADFTEIAATPGQGVSTSEASPFRSEKLYTVVEAESTRFPADGPREVLDGRIARNLDAFVNGASS